MVSGDKQGLALLFLRLLAAVGLLLGSLLLGFRRPLLSGTTSELLANLLRNHRLPFRRRLFAARVDNVPVIILDLVNGHVLGIVSGRSKIRARGPRGSTRRTVCRVTAATADHRKKNTGQKNREETPDRTLLFN